MRVEVGRASEAAFTGSESEEFTAVEALVVMTLWLFIR